MSVAAGLISLLTGLAYTLLGGIGAWELARHRSRRGHSNFGIGFLGMAAACGPHYLVHAVHLLFEGHSASWPLLISLAVGMPPGIVFTWLRLEALADGRGDRFISGTPTILAVQPALIAAISGAVLLAAAQRVLVPAGVWGWAGACANFGLAIAFTITGAIVLRTQLARRAGLGGWSVSGLCMASVFLTCSVAHVVTALTTRAELHTLVFELPGVPSAAFFLWVVHRLNRSSLNDWNRRPLVGRAARHGRPAPWAA